MKILCNQPIEKMLFHVRIKIDLKEKNFLLRIAIEVQSNLVVLFYGENMICTSNNILYNSTM